MYWNSWGIPYNSAVWSKLLKDSKVVWSVDASNYLKGLQSKSAARFPKKIIRQKGRKKIKENLMKKKILTFFFNLTQKNF